MPLLYASTMTLFRPRWLLGRLAALRVWPHLAARQAADYRAAVAFYEETLQTQPDRYAWTGRGFALMRLGRYDEAVTSYDRALEIYPDETSWCNRGHALYYLGRYDEAIASYSQALGLEPDFDAAFYGKARTYAQQGQIALALENLQQAIALSPDEYRDLANTDPAFKRMQPQPKFRTMVGSRQVALWKWGKGR